MTQDMENATSIFPITFGASEEFVDFRPTILPADAPEEDEEVVRGTDPKEESVLELVKLPESPEVTEPPSPPTPVRQPAVRANTPPKGSRTGPPAS